MFNRRPFKYEPGEMENKIIRIYDNKNNAYVEGICYGVKEMSGSIVLNVGVYNGNGCEEIYDIKIGKGDEVVLPYGIKINPYIK